MAKSIMNDEWIERYAKRMMSQANVELQMAMQLAREGWRQMTEDETGYEEPEDAADSELSYWGDDDG